MYLLYRYRLNMLRSCQSNDQQTLSSNAWLILVPFKIHVGVLLGNILPPKLNWMTFISLDCWTSLWTMSLTMSTSCWAFLYMIPCIPKSIYYLIKDVVITIRVLGGSIGGGLETLGEAIYFGILTIYEGSFGLCWPNLIVFYDDNWLILLRLFPNLRCIHQM